MKELPGGILQGLFSGNSLKASFTHTSTCPAVVKRTILVLEAAEGPPFDKKREYLFKSSRRLKENSSKILRKGEF